MLVWWWVALVVKFLLVSITPLTADENYYWVWSQKLSLSYFDHPPMVAWIFKIGSYLPEFMLKWPSVLIGHLSFFVWALVLKNLGVPRSAIQKWFLLALFAPLVGMSSMVLTPDLPLLLFISTSVYFFERALECKSLKYYFLFGLSLGLGFTAKYHIVLLVPGFILYLWWADRWADVKWKYLGAVFMAGTFGAAPVLWWNSQNGWASFYFQIHHGMGKKAWKPIWPIEYIFSVLALITPFYWGESIRAIRERKHLLFISLSVPIFGFFLLTSFRSKVEANWSQIAFLPFLTLVAIYDLTRWKSRVVAFIWAVLLLILIWQWRQPWHPGCPEKLCEPQRFQSVLEIEKRYQPFMASSYQMASYLWFQTKHPVFKVYDMSRRDFFDTFKYSQIVPGMFYLVKPEETEIPSWLLKEGFQIEKIKNVDQELVLLKVFK